MSKTVNKVQLDNLVALMQENPDIARNFTKENKEKVAVFWKKAEKELNGAGPPVKSFSEWKKVWMDQKRHVRKKASLNYVKQNATGGGPNEEVKLSSLEESILHLTGTNESVEGKGTRYGLIKPTTAVSGDDENIHEIEESFLDLTPNFSQPISSKRVHNSSDIAASKKIKVSNQSSTSELLENELETQKDLCKKIGNAIEMFKENNVEIQANLKKIYRELGRMNDNKKLYLQVIKRHNHEMESLRKLEIESKVERNRVAIQLDELKLRLAEEQEKQ